MREAVRLYKAIKKQERKWKKAGPIERKRIMKKVLILKRRFDRVVGEPDTPTFQNAGINENGEVVHGVHPDVKEK